MTEVEKAYERLLSRFGRQSWWPVKRGFRPKEWEICVGAILTQNTNWKNVEKALDNLEKAYVVSPEKTVETPVKKLQTLVRPSGFYRQKAERLKEFARFVLSYGGFEIFKESIERQELLKVKGIGFETCDSILLYACGKPYFVIDAYTKRFVRSLGWDKKFGLHMDYESLRMFFESNLPKDIEIYREFHALIVEWGKHSKVILIES